MTNSSNLSVKPGSDLCHFASGDITWNCCITYPQSSNLWVLRDESRMDASLLQEVADQFVQESGGCSRRRTLYLKYAFSDFYKCHSPLSLSRDLTQDTTPRQNLNLLFSTDLVQLQPGLLRVQQVWPRQLLSQHLLQVGEHAESPERWREVDFLGFSIRAVWVVDNLVRAKDGLHHP